MQIHDNQDTVTVLHDLTFTIHLRCGASWQIANASRPMLTALVGSPSAYLLGKITRMPMLALGFVCTAVVCLL